MDLFYIVQFNIYDIVEIFVIIMVVFIFVLCVFFNEVCILVCIKGRQYYQVMMFQYGVNWIGIVIIVKVEGNMEEEWFGCGDDMSDIGILGLSIGCDLKCICWVDEVEVVLIYSNGKRSMSDEEGGYEMQKIVRKGLMLEQFSGYI